MQAVKSKNTAIEMHVRRSLHAQGYRYRLHRKDLPGCPDMVFSSRKRVVFIHGCFWHGHSCPRGNRTPKSNTAYWKSKIERNVLRNETALRQLSALGWRSLVVWECELATNNQAAIEKIVDFLG
jgi:DNA mismatch endonuclease (patch repair protein)